MTVYERMCGLSWERKPRRARTLLKPGRGSTLKSSSLPASKTQSPRPSTSPAASLAIRRRSSINPSRLRLWDWALPRPERHGPPPGQCPGLQQRNRDRWI